MNATRKLPLVAFTTVGIAVVATIIIAVVASMMNRPTAAPSPAGTSAPSIAGALPGTASDTWVLDQAGPEAPTLVEFLDFECEYCGAAYPFIEQLRADYAGRINFAVRYFPIPSHRNSMTAAVAVEAAAQQGRIEDMYKLMYDRQADWAEQTSSKADLFRSYAEQLGLDLAAYDAAVADPATQARVQADQDGGRAMGVQGTPTFFLDGQQLELVSFSDLVQAVDDALAR